MVLSSWLGLNHDTASCYRWDNKDTKSLHDPPAVTHKVCRQPGTGTQPSTPAQDTFHGGSASPHRHAGCCRSSSPEQCQHVSLHCGALLGCSKECPSAGVGEKSPLDTSSAPHGHGCHTHTNTGTSPERDPGGHSAPMQEVNPCLAGISSASPHPVPSSSQALPATIQCRFAGERGQGSFSAHGRK